MLASYMSEQVNVILGIRQLCELFAMRSADRSTLDEIVRMSLNQDKWKAAHSLFQTIRAKNLKAIDRQDATMESQYCFEEVCAKTIYNLSGESAPFDEDSPYWVFPNAIAYARRVCIHDAEIVRIVAG